MELLTNSAYFGLMVSFIGYWVGLYLKKKTGNALCNPLLIAILFVMGALLLLKVDYASYNVSANFLTYLLTPATVCLAIPLYRQLALLKQYKLAIVLGILTGVLTSLGGVLALSAAFGLSYAQYVTLLPKSITTAIGISISDELGGWSTITVASILITGIVGNVGAESLLKLFRITNPIAKGLAIGNSSHALGTSKAIEIGEIEGAMSSLSIVVAGLITVILASVFANLYG